MVVLTLIVVIVGYNAFAGVEDAKVQTIGYVDTFAVLAGHEPAARAMMAQQDIQQALENLNNQAFIAIVPLQEEYLPKYMAAETDEVRESIESDFASARDAKLGDIGYFAQLDRFRNIAMQIESEFQTQLAFVMDAAKAVAEELHIDIVLQKDSVLYGGVDITQKVIDYLTAEVVTVD